MARDWQIPHGWHCIAQIRDVAFIVLGQNIRMRKPFLKGRPDTMHAVRRRRQISAIAKIGFDRLRPVTRFNKRNLPAHRVNGQIPIVRNARAIGKK